MNDQVEQTPLPQPERTGEELFSKILKLGVGRVFSMPIAISEAKPLNNHPPEESMQLYIPVMVSLPADEQETSHLLIFSNGRIVLVKYTPTEIVQPNYDPQEKYKNIFALSHVDHNDEINILLRSREYADPDLLLKGLLDLQKSIHLFEVVNPLSDDASLELVKERIKSASKIAKKILLEMKNRKREITDTAFDKFIV